MYKSVAILFVVCFCLYILFSRHPDYFEAEFTPGIIILPDSTDKTVKAVQYPVGKEVFVVPIEGWGASQVSKGEKVTAIYDPTTPADGSLYSFFAYWLKLPELLITLSIFIILFFSAVFITGENQPDDPPTKEFTKKRKYKD